MDRVAPASSNLLIQLGWTAIRLLMTDKDDDNGDTPGFWTVFMSSSTEKEMVDPAAARELELKERKQLTMSIFSFYLNPSPLPCSFIVTNNCRAAAPRLSLSLSCARALSPPSLYLSFVFVAMQVLRLRIARN